MNQAKRVLRIGWRLAVCLVLLGWLLNTIFIKEARDVVERSGIQWSHLNQWEQWRVSWTYGPPELWHHLILIDPAHFALSLVVMAGILLAGILRWGMVLRVHGLNLPFRRTTQISLVAHFFNSFLLGSTGGDLMKAYYAAQETHHKKAEAVVTVFIDRILGLWAMLLFAALMILPNWHLVMTHSRLRKLSGVVLLLLVGCSAGVAFLLWGGISKRWSGARDWLRRLPKGETLDSLLESCRQFGRTPGFLGKTLLLSMVLNTLCVVQFIVLAQGLHIDVPWTVLFMIVPAIICIASMPITPSGLGVREYLFVSTLSSIAFQVPAPTALSLSLLAYAGSTVWSLAGGVVYLLFKRRLHLDTLDLRTKNELDGARAVDANIPGRPTPGV